MLQDESRCRKQPSGMDPSPQWFMGWKGSPHHGHCGPACRLGLPRAWSILISPSGNSRKLLTPTHCPMQFKEAQTRAGAALGSLGRRL